MFNCTVKLEHSHRTLKNIVQKVSSRLNQTLSLLLLTLICEKRFQNIRFTLMRCQIILQACAALKQSCLCSPVIVSPDSHYPRFTSPQAPLVTLAFASGRMPFGPPSLGIWLMCEHSCVCVTGSETGHALCHQHSS